MKKRVAIKVRQIQVSSFLCNKLNDLQIASSACDVNRTFPSLIHSTEVNFPHFNQSLNQSVIAMDESFVDWKQFSTIGVQYTFLKHVFQNTEVLIVLLIQQKEQRRDAVEQNIWVVFMVLYQHSDGFFI